MCRDNAGSSPALGFLTVLDHPQHGLFGGYLVLNPAGRPIEFHCTAPIKPNRAQEILYGPTLEPFLFGEQIGQTLLQTAEVQPWFVCTDRRPALAVRDHVSLPVALVLSVAGGPTDSSGEPRRVDADRPGAPNSCGSGLVAFQLGRNQLAVPERSAGDHRLITERFAQLAESFDLAEPFTRIREAIEEAQQAVR